jgi:RNA polymerase sigma factor (sigma-70 family)
MSNSRITLDSYKFEKELFKQFSFLENGENTLSLAKSKIPDIMTYELTDTQYNIVFMYYYQNLTQKQIANSLKKNQSTVSRTLKRAKSKIFKIVKYLI